MSSADKQHFMSGADNEQLFAWPDRQRVLLKISISLAAGLFLVAGNIYPELGILFYGALLLGNYVLSSTASVSRLAVYAFWLPYSLLLGLSVWQQVFPLFFGIVLALLVGDLFCRISYLLIKTARLSVWRFFVLPLIIFWIEFTFQNVPWLNKIHLVPFMAPITYHYRILSSASWYGGPLLLLLIGLACTLPAAVFTAGIKPEIRSGLAIVLACCLVLVLLPGAMAKEPAVEQLKAASVQGSFEPEDPEADYENILAAKLDHYMAFAPEGKTDIIVFPETDFGIYDIEGIADSSYRRSLAAAAKRLGGIAVMTVMEGSSLTRSRDDRYISALVYDEGVLAGISRKRNLVPFSESRRYSAGNEYDSFTTSRGRVGVSICYDINAMTVEKLCRSGAQIILAPFNDGGFDRIYKNIHRYFPVIRAASCQVPIIVANESGISQIISRQGRIMAELMPGEAGIITADVGLKENLGFYLRYGIYISYVFYIALTILAGAIFFQRLNNYVKRKHKMMDPE